MNPSPVLQRDRAQRAADAILHRLMAYSRIEREIERCRVEDPRTWREIRTALASIIRVHLQLQLREATDD